MPKFITSEKLESLPHIKHGFFTKSGGISEGLYSTLNCRKTSADAPENINKNRMIACNSLSESAKLFSIKQTHSSIVHKFNGEFIVPEADAVVTDKKNVALSVVTADCAPVLLADPVSSVIGAAHAGWKGAQSGIIENTVSAMVDMGARVENITASIGPCIAQKSYEVGEELFEQIADQKYFIASEQHGHYMFDLERYVADKLRLLKIGKIDPLHRNTYDEINNFFSYRRKTHLYENDYGCQISIILQN